MNDLYSHKLYIVTEKINTTYTNYKGYVEKQNIFPNKEERLSQ
jgi:GTPase Era involved in 16S rRNA processing